MVVQTSKKTSRNERQNLNKSSENESQQLVSSGQSGSGSGFVEEINGGRRGGGRQRLVRNISVIAHIDHGKSTLSEFLISKNLLRNLNNNRSMDSNNQEKERGITIFSSVLHLEFDLDSEIACKASDFMIENEEEEKEKMSLNHSSNLYIGNLPSNVTEEMLVGKLEEVTKSPLSFVSCDIRKRGFATLQFESSSQLVDFVQKLQEFGSPLLLGEHYCRGNKNLLLKNEIGGMLYQIF